MKKTGPLIILAFDTSSTCCSVALLKKSISFSENNTTDLSEFDRSIAIDHREEHAQREHSQYILSMIHDLLSEHSLELSDLSACAYANGPGSFTGIRVACSVAQALGLVLNCPIFPISSLAILAKAFVLEKAEIQNIYVCLEASLKPYLHFAWYQHQKSGELIRMGDEMVTLPEKLSLALSPPLREAIRKTPTDTCYGIGEGWKKQRLILEQQLHKSSILVKTECFPSAIAVAQLALQAFKASVFPSLEAVVPFYFQHPYQQLKS